MEKHFVVRPVGVFGQVFVPNPNPSVEANIQSRLAFRSVETEEAFIFVNFVIRTRSFNSVQITVYDLHVYLK